MSTDPRNGWDEKSKGASVEMIWEDLAETLISTYPTKPVASGDAQNSGRTFVISDAHTQIYNRMLGFNDERFVCIDLDELVGGRVVSRAGCDLKDICLFL